MRECGGDAVKERIKADSEDDCWMTSENSGIRERHTSVRNEYPNSNSNGLLAS